MNAKNQKSKKAPQNSERGFMEEESMTPEEEEQVKERLRELGYL